MVSNFGGDIHDVILFGSQADDRAHEHSDYDVLIILGKEYDWEYQNKITTILYDLELKYDIFIDTKVISTGELHTTIKGKHPLYVDAIQQGIRIGK